MQKNQYMDYNNRQFMIFSTTELSQIDFTQVCETSQDTVRKSVDQTKTFVKWDAEQIPTSVENLITRSPTNHMASFSFSRIFGASIS